MAKYLNLGKGKKGCYLFYTTYILTNRDKL